MAELLNLWEKPAEEEIYMIAGWRQWADAGAISSGLPQYLVQRSEARKIGEIRPDNLYLFQIPGASGLRPEIKLTDGYRQELRNRKNDLYYATMNSKGLVIFLGDEPNMNIDAYATAFFDAVKELRVKRVAVVGGVYASTPYDKDRSISCTYSLTYMKEELAKYAIRFSNYEGNVSIGSYLVDQAEREKVEYFSFYGFVPAYEFSHAGLPIQGLRIENDYRCWYEIMRRFNHMFELSFDLSDLARQSDDLTASMDEKIEELKKKMPQLRLGEYLERLASEYEELSFLPLDDIWERELNDIFRELDE